MSEYEYEQDNDLFQDIYNWDLSYFKNKCKGDIEEFISNTTLSECRNNHRIAYLEQQLKEAKQEIEQLKAQVMPEDKADALEQTLLAIIKRGQGSIEDRAEHALELFKAIRTSLQTKG